MPDNGNTEGTETERKRDVQYFKGEEFAALDSLPASETAAGRTSPFDEMLEAVKADVENHGKWFPLSRYGNAGSASGSKSNLKKRFPAETGFKFATARTGDKTTLFASYKTPDPNAKPVVKDDKAKDEGSKGGNGVSKQAEGQVKEPAKA